MHKHHDHLTAWLILAFAKTIGIKTVNKLLRHFNEITAICRASKTALTSYGLNEQQADAIKYPNQFDIDHALSWLSQSAAHHIIPFDHPDYPSLLAEIPQPPLLLYALGNTKCLREPQIALVGSRNPSYAGLENARGFAYQLAQSGLHVTSGLALGIDALAHRGAIDANGKTIAVLGTGLQSIYPKRHQSLAEKIADNGCLVSEFPLKTTALAKNFPRRNRIVSGLSLGTLVIEAAQKSGSLITARFALEQNREVFAIPGSLSNPVAKGCLQLIQQGAKCVMQLEDILQELNFKAPALNFTKPPSSNSHNTDSTQMSFLSFFDKNDIVSIDQICERSKLPAPTVIATVLALELEGKVKASQGGYIKV